MQCCRAQQQQKAMGDERTWNPAIVSRVSHRV
jgi:hypothetical protein